MNALISTFTPVSASISGISLYRNEDTGAYRVLVDVSRGEDAREASREVATFNAVSRLALTVTDTDDYRPRLAVALPTTDEGEAVSYVLRLVDYLRERDTITSASPLLAGVARAATPVGAAVAYVDRDDARRIRAEGLTPAAATVEVGDFLVSVTIDGVSRLFAVERTDDVPVTRLVSAPSYEDGGEVLTIYGGNDARGGAYAVVFRPFAVSGTPFISTKYFVFFYYVEDDGLTAFDAATARDRLALFS